MNVDWRAIRPLNGGRDKGFEELCAQLARWEVGNRARFIRKGNPDAGSRVLRHIRKRVRVGLASKVLFDVG